MAKAKPVKPALSKESTDYINGIKNDKSSVNNKDVEEYLEHAIGSDGDREILADFIATIDRFERTDERFKRLTSLHAKAIEFSEAYHKLYKEASEEDSEMSELVQERLEWSKQNRVQSSDPKKVL